MMEKQYQLECLCLDIYLCLGWEAYAKRLSLRAATAGILAATGDGGGCKGGEGSLARAEITSMDGRRKGIVE